MKSVTPFNTRSDGSSDRSLRITFLYGNLRFSGGRKVLRDYADHLRSRGHAVQELARNSSQLQNFGYKAGSVREVGHLDRSTIPESDLIVASEQDEVRAGVLSQRGPTVHFCQGFQIHDYEYRLQHSVLPNRYQTRWWNRVWKLWRQRRKWQRRIQEFDQIYRLPTWLVCVSRELSQHLEHRYGRPVELAENGISPEHFRPAAQPPEWRFDFDRPCRILSVGSFHTTFKGINETLASVRRLKSQGVPVRFLRVTPDAPCPIEREWGVVDEFHSGLSQTQMAELYRSSHLYVSNSHPAEGFGLPAMEALRSGMVTVLSDIQSYRSFADHRRFTQFVPVRAPQKTAEAIGQLMTTDPATIQTLRQEAQTVASRFTLDNARRDFEASLIRIADKTSSQTRQAA